MTLCIRRAICLAVVAIVTVGIFMGTGCDTDSANSSITVSPSTTTLSPGESTEFTASGGYDYTWSLSPDDGSGTLDATKGSTVIYTCLATNIGTTPKKVIVTSTIEGSSSTSTTLSGTNTVTTSGYSKQGSAEVFYPH